MAMLWSGKLDGEGWREEDTVCEKEKRRGREGWEGGKERGRVSHAECFCVRVFVCVCLYACAYTEGLGFICSLVCDCSVSVTDLSALHL